MNVDPARQDRRSPMDQPSTAAAWRARANLTILPYGLVGAPPKFCTLVKPLVSFQRAADVGPGRCVIICNQDANG